MGRHQRGLSIPSSKFGPAATSLAKQGCGQRKGGLVRPKAASMNHLRHSLLEPFQTSHINRFQQPLLNAWRILLSETRSPRPQSGVWPSATPRAPCTLRHTGRAGLRRLCLHHGFHAQGATSRLTRLLFVIYCRQGLKDYAVASQVIWSSHHPQSLVLLYSRSAN